MSPRGSRTGRRRVRVHGSWTPSQGVTHHRSIFTSKEKTKRKNNKHQLKSLLCPRSRKGDGRNSPWEKSKKTLKNCLTTTINVFCLLCLNTLRLWRRGLSQWRKVPLEPPFSPYIKGKKRDTNIYIKFLSQVNNKYNHIDHFALCQRMKIISITTCWLEVLRK